MSDMHSLLVAAILGVVEGLTEFLPVSSTGHMIIVGHLLGFEGDTAKTFEVVIQLGSILAVVVMFWRRLFGLIGIHFGRLPQREGEGKGRLTQHVRRQRLVEGIENHAGQRDHQDKIDKSLLRVIIDDSLLPCGSPRPGGYHRRNQRA